MKISFFRSVRVAALFFAGLFIILTSSNSAVAATSLLPATVNVQGDGQVNIHPDNVICKAECTKSYEKYTLVTLTATPDPGIRFLGWQGECSRSQTTCRFRVRKSTDVTALFEKTTSTASGDNAQDQVSEASATLSVNSIDFGNVSVGGVSDVSTVTLTNRGDVPLTITGMTVSDGFLKSDGCNNYVPTGNSCGIQVSFVPTESGTKTGSLVINADANDAPYRVSLTGSSTTVASGGASPNGDAIPVSDNEIYRMDLSAYPHDHALTRQEAAEIFQSQNVVNSPVSGQPFDAGNIRVVNDPFGGPGKVLSIQFRKGVSGLGTAKNPSGGQWKLDFGGAYDDLYIAMELGVDENWITPKGMHLPFLASSPFVASNLAEPDIWANFFQLHGNNTFVDSVSGSVHRKMVDDAFAIYYYNLTDAQKRAWYNTGDAKAYSNSDLPHTGQVQLVRNGYVALEQRLKMNSVPSYDNPATDGLMQAWANGKPAVDKQNFAWRRDASQKLDFVWMGWWTGGPANSSEWAQPQDQKMYLRSFVVSTKPITH